MPEIDPSLEYDDVFQAIAAASETGWSTSQERSIESFGAVAEGFVVAPTTDNLAAFNAACVWSNLTGGTIRLGAGVYGVNGTIDLLPYVAMVGPSQRNAIVRQLQVQTAGGGSYAPVFQTPDDASGGGAYSFLANFHIYGGWTSLREYEGTGPTAPGPNWTYDPSLKVTPGIHYRGPSGGPSHSSIRALYNNGESDTHHILQNVLITNCAGPAVHSEGRGEHFYINLKTQDNATYGAKCETIDITTIVGGSLSVCGDTGLYIDGGSYIVKGVKAWFCGMQISAEPIAAGVHLAGSGKTGSTIDMQCQDTWGPSCLVEGRGHRLTLMCDHAGGGRLEDQGFGFAGTRTKVRSFARSSGRDNKFDMFIKGGELSATAPGLVRLEGSATQNNYFEFHASEVDTTLNATLVSTAGSVESNDNYNQVNYGKRRVYDGGVTSADLAVATHGVNDTRVGPREVTLDPNGNALKNLDGTWTTIIGTTVATVTPA